MPIPHRRPSTDVLERVGTSMRHSPTNDWGGRLPAMPRKIGGGGTTVNEREGGGGKTTRVHKAVLYVTPGSDPGTPSGDLAFDQMGAGALAAVGFEQTVQEMATNGSVTSVIMSLTGVLIVDLELLWASYRGGGDITLTLTRDYGGGEVAEEVVFSTGPLSSRYFNETEVAIDVIVGDVMTITVPG